MILYRYIAAVKLLTKQESLVICVIVGLLLTGRLVKTYRTAHPPVNPIQAVKP